MKQVMIVLSVMMIGSGVHADELSDMKKDIEALKRDVAELRGLVRGSETRNTEPSIDRKAGLRKKYEEDRKTYSEEQLREIETLYQSANKDLRSPEAKAAKALFDEIRREYPDAVNHKGKRLADLLPK